MNHHLNSCFWRLAIFLFGVFVFIPAPRAFGLGHPSYVETVASPGAFPVLQADISLDREDYAGVIRAAADLQQDVRRVSGRAPSISQFENGLGSNVIFVGTIGHSRFIDKLIQEHRIDATAIAGKWESFLIQAVPRPMPGVASGLVIAGSDKRGTIYGIYDLSEQLGVSPWYWWADVPVEHKSALYVKVGAHRQGPPAVKYRGIFINDEWPDLSNWVGEKYGYLSPGVANYGNEFYTNLFELILRLKGNYLWPAMWSNAFNLDDPINPQLADAYGIVMGTTHQEPMMRAQKEWDRQYFNTLGSWNYARHPDTLENFWRDGIRRNKNWENIITLGLRGADDMPMSSGSVEANRALLEKIVATQRNIIREELNPDPAKIPQLWCLYKEAQDYYTAGMRVPDDVTLLWADDNYGNIRRLPTAAERQRPGGAGIYYHLEYHGPPLSYQWINTSQLSKTWDQLSLAKEYGADRIWIVNVGHLKGYEFPLEFFMNLAWDTSRWSNTNLDEFTQLWAQREFGPAHASDIARIISESTKFNDRRKPEQLEPGTYSINHYREAQRVVDEFQSVSDRAESIYDKLPQEKRDAFYELVLFPVKAASQLNSLYFAAARNKAYAREGRASANDMAIQVRDLFQAHTNLMNHFNKTFANGKWDHFMDQPHIGYTNWRVPPENSLRAIKLVEFKVPDAADMGIAVEGSDDVASSTLPQFDVFNRQRHYVDIFNKGKTAFEFTAVASKPWVILSETNGIIAKDKRLWISVNWDKAPAGLSMGTINIIGANTNLTVKVAAFNPTEPARPSIHGFVEGEGVVSIEPEHFTKNLGVDGNCWIKIEDYGRTLSGMRATGPVDAPSATPGKNSPCLEYRMFVFDKGTAEVTAIVGPALNFMPGRSLNIGISFDDGSPQILTVVPASYNAENRNRDWVASVKNNARSVRANFALATAGWHALKIWMIDPGIVLQKLVVNKGGQKDSYLGPPESYFQY